MQIIDRHRQATRFFIWIRIHSATSLRDDCRTQLLQAMPGCQGPGFGIKFINLLIDWGTGMCYAMGFVKLKYKHKRDTRDKILGACAFATFPCILNAMNGRNHSLHATDIHCIRFAMNGCDHSLHATTFLGMRRFRVLTYIYMSIVLLTSKMPRSM